MKSLIAFMIGLFLAGPTVARDRLQDILDALRADLARWGWLLWSGRAMELPYLEEMLQGIETGTPGRSYGLAVGIDLTGSDEVLGHGGWIPGYVGSLRYHPAQDTAIAIQINTDIGMLGAEGAFDAIELAIHDVILEFTK